MRMRKVAIHIVINMKSLNLYSKFFEHIMGKEKLIKFIIKEEINKKWEEKDLVYKDS